MTGTHTSPNSFDPLVEFVRSCDPDHAYPEHDRNWVNPVNGYSYRWNGNTQLYHKTKEPRRMTLFC